MDREVVQIGEEEIVIDPLAPPGGIPDYGDDVEEGFIRIRRDFAANPPPDPGARSFLEHTLPMTVLDPKAKDPKDTIRACKDPYCKKMVEQNPDPRAGMRLFCSRLCAQRYHRRLYDKRRRNRGSLLEMHPVLQEPVQFFRTKPLTKDLAEGRYQSHVQASPPTSRPPCPLATKETNYRCPAVFHQDYESEDHRCLIYATLVDDMKEMWAHERRRVYLRKYTTNDGRWFRDSEFDPHLDREKEEVPERIFSDRGY